MQDSKGSDGNARLRDGRHGFQSLRLAHDFNNLLSVIIGYSELLSANLGSEGPASVRLETIKKAGMRAASLTSQLLVSLAHDMSG
ncbi:MAG: histidine kinase dimerization/phospho-acceptor domain-containing protein [Verrucomicrobiia bacterium]